MKKMKIDYTIRVMLILAISLTFLGQVSGHNSGTQLVQGKAFLIGTVDVKTLSLTHSQTGSPRGSTSIPLGADPVRTPSTHPQISPASTPLSTPSSTSTVSSSIGFDGINQAQSGGWTPPDPNAAVGPNHVFEVVNVLGGIYTKQGGLVQTVNLYQFFKTPANAVPVDPKVLFDASSGRWFASSINAVLPNFAKGNVSLAVSTSNDPTGSWNVYILCPGSAGTCPGPGNILPDQPIIGISDDKFVASVNDFYGASGVQYWVLNKSEMVSGASSLDFVSYGPNSSLTSVHPVQSSSTTTTQYMVSTGSNTVTLFSITGVPPNPVTVNTSSLSISPLSGPPNGVQKGTSSLISISLSGNRVMSAVWFQGKLWYSADDGCTPSGDSQQRSCVRLTQINTGTSSVTQDFDFSASSYYFFYPAVSVDVNGNLDVIYGFSSANDYPSLAITGQSILDTSGSLAPAVTVKAGIAPNTSGRYGDYFGAGVDPSDSTIVWVSGEYGSTSNGSWATFIANMVVSGGPFPNSFVHITTTTQTVSELTVPESEQRTFQNPRGQHSYYVFYRDSISSVQSCYLATSPDGLTWTAAQGIGLSTLYDSCSVIYAQDPSNARTLVYFVVSRHSTSVGTNHNINFRIGSINDSSVAITWLTGLAAIKSSNSTENLGYPTIAQDSNGYLHVAFSYTNDASGTVSDKQNVEVCSSTTTNPTTNPSWVCSDPRSNNPFPVESVANIDTPVAMPHVLRLSSGVLIIKGVCSGAEANFITCSLGSDVIERSTVMTWNGATQSWGNTASFTFVNTTPRAEVRTSAVNDTGTFRVHYAYEDGGKLITRYIDSPYATWSTAITACGSCAHIYGAHFTHVVGNSIFERFVLFYSTGFVKIFSVNATDNEAWGASQLEYQNSTYDADYPTSAAAVIETSRSSSFIPLVWVNAASNREIWFNKRPLN